MSWRKIEMKSISNLRNKLKPRPYLLKNKIQNYVWGSRNKNAFIPHFLGIEAKSNRPYAELWIGAHPKAPSEVIIDGSPIPLDQLISHYPLEILGEAVSKKFSGMLPFLFKLLSAAEALSIQAHPDKKQAKILHSQNPEQYPDDNHKPEIAIALDSLTALVGFKSRTDILQALKKYPELAEFIGMEIVYESSHLEDRDFVHLIYSTLMQRSISYEKELIKAINKLEKRLKTSPTDEELLFLELRKKYSGADTGLFSIFLLNLIHLEAGQAIFIDAGIPHAYLKGNIVECMANSDNVVRAGLTPKFKDIKTLVEILTYDTKAVTILGENSDLAEIVYQTPASEFRVTQLKMKSDQEKKEASEDKPQVLLITKGKVIIRWESHSEIEQEEFHQGQSILIPACLKKLKIIAITPAKIFKVDVPLV